MKKLIKKILAKLFGYFWLPCPVCGEEFAGFEINAYSGHVTLDDGSQQICCPKCNFAAGKIEGAKKVVTVDFPPYEIKYNSESDE